MASVIVNGPTPTVTLTRGRPVALGTLAATGNAVQFSIAQENAGPNGLECLTMVLVGAGSAAGLEASIDGGVTWFGVNPRAANGTAPNFTDAGAINGDTAVTHADSYDVSSLQCALFRYGVYTSGSSVVWALYS